MRRLIAAIAFIGLAACGSTTSKLGPLEITPPDGWLVTDRTPDSIKVTNGTIADEESTEAGTATAVFDVYVDSTQTVEEFVDVLEKENAGPKQERLEVDDYDAVIVTYASGHFGPSTEVLFVPAWNVRAVYRAAFIDDENAFDSNRDDFRQAVASIRFEGRPPNRA